MAYNFSENLAIQLQMLPPTAGNINTIRKQIESGLSGINVGSLNTKNFVKANADVDKLSKSFEKGEEKAKSFFDRVEGKARSFAAYTVASTAILKLTGAVSQATREAIKYETELLKISQVTGDSVKRTRDLQKTLFDVSKAYNVNITKVAQLTRTLSQTGLSFREAAKGAEILARTSLLATFDSLTSTTEGLIAVMQTFNLTVNQGGKVLEKINAVSKQFAVESGDIVEAIRRTGGAFSTAGGQVEELIALFTSVRSTSRESAETIATGFRTIFGRLQRPKTIEYFKKLGIQLETAEGQFIGPLKAIEQISNGLDRLGIKAGSVRFAEVIEQIGGIRQISRVVPLLEEYRKTQRALDIQNSASVESYKDIEKAQKGLGFQIGALKQEFGELIAEFVNSGSFKVIAKTFIGFTRTIISLTKALKPLLPLITALATVKIGRGISKMLSGGISFKGMKESLGFARGGVVPGSGNRDTVPAMLTPGEFVVRKSAVKAYGADRLAKINKYGIGGTVQKLPNTKGLYNESINAKNVNQQSKLPASAKGSIKGLIFEKFVKTRLGKSGSIAADFPDIQGNSAVRKLLGNSKLDHVELKYEDNKDTRYAYRKGVRDNYQRLGYATEKTAFDKIGMVYGFANGGKAEKPKKEFGQILLSEDGKNIEAKYAPNENRTGFVRTKFWKDNLYTIGLSQATKGYGPKLYDVVMEAITAKGGMLTSDRATVSGDARKVWDFYFKNRSDVKKTPLSRDQWTGNYALVDEKLRGPEDTWPPADDPAWTLQTGYSKSPNLINDPKIVKRVKKQQSSAAMALNYFSRFANGGSVNTGTDTVPALLTPGEFVINKRSAQSFGYGNLEEINRYQNGGVVLSKEEKKRRREQYKSDQLGTSLTRGERTGGWQKEILAKYSKLIAEEKAAIQEVYAEKIKNAIMERKSAAGIINEKNRLQKEAEKNLTMGMNAAIKSAESNIDMKKEADKLSKANEKLVIIQNKAATSTEKLAEAHKKNNLTIAESIFYAEALANSLEQMGFSINRAGLEAGKTKAAGYETASRMVENITSVESMDKFSRQLKTGGDAIAAFGKKIGGKTGKLIGNLGGSVSRFGSVVYKNAGKIAAFGKTVGVVGRIIAGLELVGGFIDALFGVDFKKQKENYIAVGNVQKAGEAAIREYNQEIFRGIPIIGGLLSAMIPLMPEFLLLNNSQSRLIRSTAELDASMVNLDKVIERTNKDLSNALIRNKPQEIQNALDEQYAAIQDVKMRADEQGVKIKEAQQNSLMDGLLTILAMGAGGATAGALTGVSIAGIAGQLGPQIGLPEELVTAPVLGTIGGIIGGLGGLYAGIEEVIHGGHRRIMAAYESQGKAYERLGEIMSQRVTMLGDQFGSMAQKIILSGGTVEQAIQQFKEKFGDQAFKDLFGDINAVGFADLERGIRELSGTVREGADSIRGMEDNIAALKIEVDKAWTPAWWNLWQGTRYAAEEALEAAENEKKHAEALQKVAENRYKELIEAQAAIKKAETLARMRMIENRAMAESVKNLRALIGAFDSLNNSSIAMKLALDDVNAARNGGLSQRQALSRRGIGVSAETINMSSEQILRNDTALAEITEAVDRLGNVRLSRQLRRGQENLDVVNRLEQDILSGGKISEAITEATINLIEGAEAGNQALNIKDKMMELLFPPGMPVSAEMEAAILEYAEAIAEGTDQSVALEQMRGKLSEEQIKLIEETKGKYAEYIQMEQELNNMKIEQIHRNGDLSQKAYQAEKEYFEQRIALTNKVDDVLNEVPSGPERVGFLRRRAAQRRGASFEGLRSARGRGGLPDDTERAETDFGARLRILDINADDASQTLAQLAVDGNALLSTLQDEIKLEQEYLDSLIEVAKAQQEYTQALNDAQGELVRDLVTGTDEEQADLLTSLNAAAMAAIQGSFQGIPEDMKKGIFSIFDQFGDVVIPGLGVTGRQAEREITKNELMMNWGLDEITAGQLADKAIKKKVPIEERMAEMIKVQEQKILELLERERQMKQYLQMIDMYQNQIFAQAVEKFAQSVENFVNTQLNANPENETAEVVRQEQERLNLIEKRQQAERDAQQEREKQAEEKRQAAEENLEKVKEQGDRARTQLKNEEEELARKKQADEDTTMTQRAVDRAKARVQERERDEAKAEEKLDKANRAVEEQREATARLQMEHTREMDAETEASQQRIDDSKPIPVVVVGVNDAQMVSKGGIIYANGGTLVNYEPKGTDTVPAMLTPGEFVMRKSAVDKIGVDNLEKMNRYGTLYAADGTEVPDPQLAYRQELINRINNEKQNIEERTGDLGILGSLFAGFRNLTTGDGGNIGDAVSQSKINAYQHALDYGDEELIRQMATGRGAYGGTAGNFGDVATSQAELMDTQNELAKDLYMTVPKALAGYATGTAAASYSAISGTALTGAETIGMNLGLGSMLALPVALMKEAPSAALEGREYDKEAIGQDVIGDVVVGPGLDLLPGSSALADSAGGIANILRKTQIGGNTTTAIGEAVDILGRAGQSVGTNKLEDSVANNFNRGGHVKYLANGGSATPYRSDANIARYGASDPRFEQYGRRGLDPNSPYYERALAYWQQIIDFQNKYNQRAAYWNQGIVAQQLQWIQMMQGLWGQSGYFAKGGKVQYLQRGGRKNPVNPHTLAPLQEKLDRDSMGSVIGDAAANLSTLVPGAFEAASTPFIVGKEGSDKRKRNQARSDEFDALYKHYMLDNMRASADVFDWPGMFGVNRFANDTLLDENGVELPMSQQPDYVKQSRFDRNWEKGLDTIGENVFGVKPKTKYEDQDAFTQWGMRLLGYKSPERRQEEAANSPEGRKAKADTDAQVQRMEDARKERASARASAKSEKIAMYQRYRDKYGEDLSDEDIQLFENTKTRTQMYKDRNGEITSDPHASNSNIEYRNGLAFKKDPTKGSVIDPSFVPEKAFVDIAPGPFEQKLIDKQNAAKQAQEAATQQATTPIAGTASGVGAMTLSDKPQTFGSMIDEEIQQKKLGRASEDPFPVLDDELPIPEATQAPITGATAGGVGAMTLDAAEQAASGAATADESTGPSFTPTGNIGVDALMNKPLDIKEGKERGNQARYRSRLEALRRAGADNSALDEFKSQYRGQVYGAENQQLYEYNKARLSGRAATMIHPSERTPEQEARAQAYKDDILAPNAASFAKSQETGSPMPSMQERAAAYQKKKTDLPNGQQQRNAAPNMSETSRSRRSSNLMGQLSGGGGSSGGGGGGGGNRNMSVNTSGSQEVTVNIPGLAAIINQNVTSIVMNEISEAFRNLGQQAATSQNFDDLANAFNQGYEKTAQKQMT